MRSWLAGLVTTSIAVAATFVVAVAALPVVTAYRTHIVMSGSMEPAISVGALVVSAPLVGPAQPGDILTFASPFRPAMVVHRVVAVEVGAEDIDYVTKGDANEMPDGWRVLSRAASGRVTTVIPLAGYALGTLQRPTVRIGIGLFVLVFAVSSLGLFRRQRHFPWLISIWPPRTVHSQVRADQVDHAPERRGPPDTVSVLRLAPALLVAGLVATSVGGAEADIAAAAINTSTFSSTALYEPSALAGSPAGRTVPLTWTAASGGGNGNGYVIWGVNIGSNSATACSTDPTAYTTFVIGAGGTSYTDTGLAGGTDGTYVCYLAQTGYSPAGAPPWTSAPTWTSAPVASATPVVAKTAIGFFATSVAFTNGGIANTLDAGDTIILTFDQPVDTTSVPAMTGVCAKNLNATIYLGQTLGVATCSTSFNVGTLTGMTLSSVLSLDGLYNATAVWSNSNKTYTITIGALVAGSVAVSFASGSETYIPAAAIKSSIGPVAICATTSACTPSTTGRP